MPLLTLTEVKTHLNYPDPSDTTDDVELQGFVDAAIDVAEFYVGPLESQEVTETHFDFNSTVLVLREAPVLSITSVTTTTVNDTTVTTLTASDYRLDTESGLVLMNSRYSYNRDVTVDYLAGRATLPSSVRLGILELIAHWWQRGQEGSLGGAIGSNAYDQPDTTAGADHGVPYSVIDKFRPYLRSPSVA